MALTTSGCAPAADVRDDLDGREEERKVMLAKIEELNTQACAALPMMLCPASV